MCHLTEIHAFEVHDQLLDFPQEEGNEERKNYAPDSDKALREGLKLTAADTVEVKMDIEGRGWPILESWLKDPQMAEIVDKLFVEIHYNHSSSSMSEFKWNSLYMALQYTHMSRLPTSLLP
ncbi:unnamed protein product [Sphagnum jensenii]